MRMGSYFRKGSNFPEFPVMYLLAYVFLYFFLFNLSWFFFLVAGCDISYRVKQIKKKHTKKNSYLVAEHISPLAVLRHIYPR